MKTSNNSDREGLPLVDEKEYKLFINGLYYNNLLCTPKNIEELTLGFLYTNCHISAVGELEKINVEGYTVNADIKYSEHPSVIETREEYIELPPVDELRDMVRQMFNAASIYKKHGGIHCSAFTDGTRLLAFKEDIGRHNAFDKVVGELLQKGLNPSDFIYLTSGRVNNEVMQKTLSSRIPAVVSRSICSSAAYERAIKHRVMVIGRILEDEPIIYGSLRSREYNGDL